MADDDDNTTIDVDTLKVEELRKELAKLKLPCTGSKTVSRERLRATLQYNEDDADEDDADEENSDSEGDDDEDAERSGEVVVAYLVAQHQRRRPVWLGTVVEIDFGRPPTSQHYRRDVRGGGRTVVEEKLWLSLPLFQPSGIDNVAVWTRGPDCSYAAPRP
ncbi:hypothetical protein EAI_16747 [Harpegnathos saltator]|uniref:SAP domain-containing protein n=1 Tax=Harpegnathos saltator TaxID=610380 RepID=E2BV31_HARSA|nr:hypothetical protein EAI_16747 [Harpegnathos saltator]